MGKKNREEMATHEKKFIEGAVERGLKREKAEQIFSLMAQFADYGFNRSHSVAYAYLAFQTAYLKAHFPEHFYAAVLSNELDDTSKVFKYSTELRSQSIVLLPPDVNESGVGFTPLKGAIRYGLAAIKGVGQTSVHAIVEARKSGPFRGIYDFTERVAERAVNKRVLESLVCAGAFDSLRADSCTAHLWRAKCYAVMDTALEEGTRAKRNTSQGQEGLFGQFNKAESLNKTETLPDVTPWTNTHLLAMEKNAVGFYITGHPLENYRDVIAELKCLSINDVIQMETGAKVKVAGVVVGPQIKNTKKGARFCLFRLEDHVGGIKCCAWPETFTRYGKMLEADVAVLLSGRLEVSLDQNATLFIEEVAHLDDVMQKQARAVTIRLPYRDDPQSLLGEIFQHLDRHRGDCEVFVEMVLDDGLLVRARPHHALRVAGSPALEKSLVEYGCQVTWAQSYA
jgi:DNA polymerase-3 subunit alpha